MSWDGTERRSSRDFCGEHTQLVADIATIKVTTSNTASDVQRIDKRVNGAFERMAKHIEEGDKPGGFRDRVFKLEELIAKATQEKLNSTKATQWRIGLIAGLPGMIFAILKIIDTIKGWIK